MKKKISKGYKGREYSFIVKDLMKKLNENIKTEFRKKVFVEQTLSMQNVIAPTGLLFKRLTVHLVHYLTTWNHKTKQAGLQHHQFQNQLVHYLFFTKN